MGILHQEDQATGEHKVSPNAGSKEFIGFETDEHRVGKEYFSSTRFWGPMVAIGLGMWQHLDFIPRSRTGV